MSTYLQLSLIYILQLLFPLEIGNHLLSIMENFVMTVDI